MHLQKVVNDKPLDYGILFFMDWYKNRSLKNIAEVIDNIIITEQWNDVVGYEGYYKVSTFGRIKSLKRQVFQPQFQKWALRKERIIAQTLNKYGYCKIVLQVDNVRVDTTAHVIVGTAYLPNPENKTQINHKKGNKTDNRPTELEWNTAKENSNHAISIGIDSVVGVHNGRCILSEKDVLAIREGYEKGKHNNYRNRMSKKYGVSTSQVGKICLGYLWKHLNNKDGHTV